MAGFFVRESLKARLKRENSENKVASIINIDDGDALFVPLKSKTTRMGRT